MLAQAQVGAVDDDRRRHGRVPVSWSAEVTEAEPTTAVGTRDSAIVIRLQTPLKQRLEDGSLVATPAAPATLEVPSRDDAVPCQVLDISAGGVRLRLSGALALLLTQIDDTLVLTLGEGAFTGRVAWRRGAEIGLAFHHLGALGGFPPLPKVGNEAVLLH